MLLLIFLPGKPLFLLYSRQLFLARNKRKIYLLVIGNQSAPERQAMRRFYIGHLTAGQRPQDFLNGGVTGIKA